MQKRKMTKIKKDRALKICVIDDIPLNGAKGFMIDNNDFPLQLFVIRKDKNIHAYENRCPHMGTNLDWQPDQFLDLSNSLIQCSTHGALFRIEDGLCVFGPCINQSLTEITSEIRNNNVIVFVPEMP